VEPADTGFGLGFSDVLAACFDSILDMVREELASEGGTWSGSSGRPQPAPATSTTCTTMSSPSV